MGKFIQLDRIVYHPVAQALRYEFSSSLDLFHQKSFFVRYSRPLEESIESINTIPFAALMAPVAWATGADLILPSLDRKYLESLSEASTYWKKCYPKWPFSTSILTNVVSNKEGQQVRTGMLYSGGLDSLATYLHNRDENPELFCILGADIPLKKEAFVRFCKARLFDRLAFKENLDLTYIDTDIRDVLNKTKLASYAPNWYATVQYGLMLTALTAPVSHHELKKLIISSCSHKVNYHFPCGGDPEVVRSVRWGGTHVEDHLHDITRAQKVTLYLKPNPEFCQFLRVCWVQHEKINCSECEKCFRTICECLINNVDPNMANFNVTDQTLPLLRKKLEENFHIFTKGDEGTLDFWREIQRTADLDTMTDMYGSGAFFRWFKGFKKLQQKEHALEVKFWLIMEKAKSLFSPNFPYIIPVRNERYRSAHNRFDLRPAAQRCAVPDDAAWRHHPTPRGAPFFPKDRANPAPRQDDPQHA